jgi:hypothetical protein
LLILLGLDFASTGQEYRQTDPSGTKACFTRQAEQSELKNAQIGHFEQTPKNR